MVKEIVIIVNDSDRADEVRITWRFEDEMFRTPVMAKATIPKGTPFHINIE